MEINLYKIILLSPLSIKVENHIIKDIIFIKVVFINPFSTGLVRSYSCYIIIFHGRKVYTFSSQQKINTRQCIVLFVNLIIIY